MSTSSWLGRAAMLAAMASVTATQSGCIEVALLMAMDDDDDPPEWDDEWDPPPVETPIAPQVQTVIADWPPMGPNATLTVNAASQSGIDSAQLSFRNEVTLWANGELNTTFFPTGLELGEGLGRLEVTVTGRDGAWTTQYVEDLLVDLSPPVAVLGPTTLPANDASFDFWMGDAWVVSSARLEFGGEVIVDELLEEGYPDTLGVEWDYSLVRVPVEDLPAITDVATITVRDAAGNESSQQFTLSIDGTAPTASFSAPEDGATVTGVFQIVVEAFDQQPGPIVIEVSAGGAPLATAVGPEAVLFVDASELAEGPLTLTAVARDEAGNASLPVVIDVVVDHGDDEEEPPPEESPPEE